MKFKYIITTLGLCFVSLSANAVVLYQDDFDSVSSPTFSTNFGSTQVVGPVLGNPTNSLAFNSAGNAGAFFYDQIEYGVDVAGSLYQGAGFDNFRVDFDINTSGLRGSDNVFTVFIDAPTVRNLNFFSDGAIRVFNPAGPITGAIGSYTDGVSQHVGMNFDIGNDLWEIFLDGTLAYSAVIGSERLRSIRFSHGLQFLGAVDPNGTTYIDNIVISAVPLPAAVWLFGSALLGLIGFSRRKLAT